MNASFRTAFWAMCLGLTVPMVLLVGVELTSGGRAARNSSLAAAVSNASLRSQWAIAGSKRASRDESAPRFSEKSSSPRRHVPGNDAKPETRDPTVVLGPFLELDQAAAEPEFGTAAIDNPAVATGSRPRADIIPDEIDIAPGASDDREIENRLATIQSHLDRLGRALADQPPRDPPADPVRQAAELLKQLQQARELDRIAAQFPRLTDPEPAGEIQKPAPAEKKTEPADADKPGLVPDPLPAADKKPRLSTKIYRPRYLSPGSLQSLVAPLLTPEIGKAAASDAGTDESPQAAGRDSSPAPVSAVVVRDYPEVLRKIDLLVKKLDVPPIRVMIEATAVTVSLRGNTPQGIDLQAFNAAGKSFVVTPPDGIAGSHFGTAAPPLSGASLPPASCDPALTHGFGLKCGVLKGDPRAFLTALEAAEQTRRVSSWQINVLNRQSAQVMLNDRLGAEGSAGMILKVRPVVAPGGIVHLDVRRDADHDASASGNRSAALTHLIVVPEGHTALVGGFYSERAETILILTPHVIPRTPIEGSQTRRADRPQTTTRERPIVQQAAGARSIQGPRPPNTVAPHKSVSIAPEWPAVQPSVIPEAALQPPRRLPHESTAPVRLMNNEALEKNQPTDTDVIPILELPADVEPGPTIRPAGGK